MEACACPKDWLDGEKKLQNKSSNDDLDSDSD